jgi:hypothetical protein
MSITLPLTQAQVRAQGMTLFRKNESIKAQSRRKNQRITQAKNQVRTNIMRAAQKAIRLIASPRTERTLHDRRVARRVRIRKASRVIEGNPVPTSSNLILDIALRTLPTQPLAVMKIIVARKRTKGNPGFQSTHMPVTHANMAQRTTIVPRLTAMSLTDTFNANMHLRAATVPAQQAIPIIHMSTLASTRRKMEKGKVGISHQRKLFTRRDLVMNRTSGFLNFDAAYPIVRKTLSRIRRSRLVIPKAVRSSEATMHRSHRKVTSHGTRNQRS